MSSDQLYFVISAIYWIGLMTTFRVCAISGKIPDFENFYYIPGTLLGIVLSMAWPLTTGVAILWVIIYFVSNFIVKKLKARAK